MGSAFIQRFRVFDGLEWSSTRKVLASVRSVWVRLAHLPDMNSEELAALGLERLLTTRELADYLGVRVQAIYDLRSEGRGPLGTPVGRELRFSPSDIRSWLDGRHETGPDRAVAGGDL